jgi:hypothetical protein
VNPYQILITLLFVVYVLMMVRRIGTGSGRHTAREAVEQIIMYGVIVGICLYIQAT